MIGRRLEHINEFTYLSYLMREKLYTGCQTKTMEAVMPNWDKTKNE